MDIRVTQLINEAQRRMKTSRDPMHALDHVERVVAFAERLADKEDLNEQERHALILAAWWHDVSRTLTRNPSIVWMPLIDDFLSALMLWWATIRFRLFGPVVGMATRMIFSKGVGTGTVLTRVLMRKRERYLLHLLEDADALDVLTPQRTAQAWVYVDASKTYYYGYRLAIWWLLRSRHLHMKTYAAKQQLREILEQFIAWGREAETYAWHVAHYGERWMEETLARADALLQHVVWQLAIETVE